MEYQRLLTVALALSCVFGLSIAAQTLGSAVDTKPEDAVDINWDKLPIGDDVTDGLRNAVTGDGGTNGNRGQGTSDSGVREGGSGDPTNPAPNPGEVTSQGVEDHGVATTTGDDGNEVQDGVGTPTNEQGQIRGGTPAPYTTAAPPKQSLLEWILSLLRSLLPLLLLIPLILGAVLALRRYGKGGAVETGTVDQEPQFVAAPEDDISAKWYEMVSLLGLEGDWSKTPGDVLHAAQEQGVNMGPVQTITTAYEDVRYGEEELTDERERSVEQAIRLLRAELAGEDER